MRIKRIAIAVALCCFGILAFSSGASAQMGMGRSVPNYGGKFNPTVGLGADYAITTSKGENMKMSMAIVGKESVNGQQGYWMQIGIDGAKKQNGPMYMKWLSVITNDQVTTTKMLMGMNGQVYEMPNMMAGSQKRSTDANIEATGQNLGTESITVPAGTFQTTHWRSKDGDNDVWVMKDAGPWGMVKMVSKEGTTAVLTKSYTDAKDMLTGPVTTFPGMPK